MTSKSALILPMPESFVKLYESPFNETLVNQELLKLIPPKPKKTLVEEVMDMAQRAF